MASIKKQYDGFPITLTDTSWFYADKSGITVVAELKGVLGTHVGTTQTRITWRKLKRYIPKDRP